MRVRARWVVLGLVLVVLLVPAGALTFARLVSPGGGFWVRAVAYTPFAIPLYAVAFLLLLVALITTRRGWRTLAAVLTVLSVIGLALHLYWVRGPYTGPEDIASPGDPTVRVMTLDLRQGLADPARVVGLAVHDDVDVLVLQEVTARELAAMDGAGLDKAYSHLAGSPAEGAAGTMVFSRYELGEAARLPTGLASYAMDVQAPGADVHLLAVHARQPSGDASAWAQDQAAIAQAAADANDPTVVIGDFNATLDHAAMRRLLDDGFRDAADTANSRWQPTWPSAGQVSVLGFAEPSVLALDHVLVSGRVRVLHTATVQVPGTDHRALLAILSL
ncbi:MAG TPA: endonuclease/exonuclease/phosphatase family protein [Nocardioidaceae bacterium]|nr:endonuclease/exonuclease/phosphatase family protein [Nocardioidaceae bacterium]